MFNSTVFQRPPGPRIIIFHNPPNQPSNWTKSDLPEAKMFPLPKICRFEHLSPMHYGLRGSLSMKKVQKRTSISYSFFPHNNKNVHIWHGHGPDFAQNKIKFYLQGKICQDFGKPPKRQFTHFKCVNSQVWFGHRWN